MKATTIINVLIIGSICLILYFFMGRNYVNFNETEILETAASINKQCNENGACPETLEGWKIWRSGEKTLIKNGMLYYISSGDGDKGADKSKDRNAFRLVYGLGLDDWFEAQGGVGKKVTSGMRSRDPK